MHGGCFIGLGFMFSLELISHWNLNSPPLIYFAAWMMMCSCTKMYTLQNFYFQNFFLILFCVASGEMVAWMKGHVSPIHSISVHASGRYALTTSSDTALLWDLDTFTRRRKLNVKENVGISKVGYLPLQVGPHHLYSMNVRQNSVVGHIFYH